MTRHAMFLLAMAFGVPATLAQQPAAAPASPVAPAAAPAAPVTPIEPKAVTEPPQPSDILPGRPDVDPSLATNLLDPEFESKAHGIALRPPKGSKPMRRLGSQNIVEFVDDARGWTLKVSKIVLDKPGTLTESRDPNGTVQPGVLEFTAKRLKEELPGSELIRQDRINIATADVGLLVLRYTQNLKSQLAQQAIIQKNSQIYYLLALTTPGAGRGGKDPAGTEIERQAVETFRQVLDSVKLLDDTAVRDDQNARLIRTRGLLVSLSPKYIKQSLIPKQWTRILKNGKDVGYAYFEERTTEKGFDGAKAKDPKAAPPEEYLEIRTRTRVLPTAESQNDIGSIQYATLDMRHEDWSTLTEAINKKLAGNKDYRPGRLAEFGVSDRKKLPGQGDVYSLQVIYEGAGVPNDPIVRELPPFYLPQAIAYLLPRLVPTGADKTYAFAVYVPETREVMMRYVDVHKPEKLTFNNQIVRGTRIDDRIGLEGAITTHYFSADHVWLGSENKTTGTTLLPSDEKTLLAMWKDANLAAPQAAPEHHVAPAGGGVTQTPAPAADGPTAAQPNVPRLGLKPANP